MSNRIDTLIEAATDIHSKLQEKGYSDKAANAMAPAILITAGLEMVCSEIEDLRSQQAMIAAVEAIKVLKVKMEDKKADKTDGNGAGDHVSQ